MTEKIEIGINKINITTTISPEYKAYLHNNHIKTSDALARGVKAYMEGNKSQYENEELKLKVERLSTKLYELNSKLLLQQEEIDVLKVKK